MPSSVVIPASGRPTRRVLVEKVHSVVCHRYKHGEEQYLVRWNTDTPTNRPPLSWHGINELSRCLEYVQDYLDGRAKSSTLTTIAVHPKKRKSPGTQTEIARRPSPVDRQMVELVRTTTVIDLTEPDEAPISGITTPRLLTNVYNGVLDSKDGFVYARKASGPDIARIDVRNVPTPEMAEAARHSKTDFTALRIREAYTRRLRKLPGPEVSLVNTYDKSTPSLRFQYIHEYVLGEGVYKLDPAAQEGCQKCSPHMGRNMGCEYTKKCDCLEYAAVDEARLNEEQKREYQVIKANGGSTSGLPKKFPYFTDATKHQHAGSLVKFYLDSRNPIYECNDNCRCGPNCRNKNVQFGRIVELEIFRTRSRGWGLRCRQPLFQGQFVDTYRGEVITDAEATQREEAGGKGKASYLYSLDKFAESEGLAQEDIFVVDGEFMGGPTKFMNHSCNPNCRQYTVSYNKHDCRIYDLAFFACRDIPAGEELTFDYLDKEEEEGEEEEEEPGEGAVPCLCGASKCRKWLWT